MASFSACGRSLFPTSPARVRHESHAPLDIGALELVKEGEMGAEKARLYGLVKDQVIEHWSNAGIDIEEDEVHSIVTDSLSICAVDVAEIYSPHRFSARVAEFIFGPASRPTWRSSRKMGRHGIYQTQRTSRSWKGSRRSRTPSCSRGLPRARSLARYAL